MIKNFDTSVPLSRDAASCAPFISATEVESLVEESIQKAVTIPVFAHESEAPRINIGAIHIHYHGPEHKPEAVRLNQDSPINQNSLTVKIRDIVRAIKGYFDSNSATEKPADSPSSVKGSDHEAALQEQNKKRNDRIQKIAIFILGCIVGSMVSAGAIAGTRLLFQTALAISAAAGVIRYTNAIIGEITKVFSVAKSIFDALIEA